MWYLMEDIGGWRRKCGRRGDMIEGGCTGSVGIGGKRRKMLDICAAVLFVNS